MMDVCLWVLCLVSVASSQILQQPFEQKSYGYMSSPPIEYTVVNPYNRRVIRVEPPLSVSPRGSVSSVLSDHFRFIHDPLPLSQDTPAPAYPGVLTRTSRRRFLHLTPATISLLRQLQARRRVKREDPSSEFLGNLLDSVNLSFLLEAPPCLVCTKSVETLETETPAQKFHRSLCKKLSGSSDCLLHFIHQARPEEPTFDYDIFIEAIKVPGLLEIYEDTGEMPDIEFVTNAVQEFIDVYEKTTVGTPNLKLSNYVIGLIASLEEVEDLPADSVSFVDGIPVAIKRRIFERKRWLQ